MKHNEGNNVFLRAAAVPAANFLKVIPRCVGKTTPSLDNQHLGANKLLADLPTHPCYK